MFDLRPRSLDESGLVAALRESLAHLRAEGPITYWLSGELEPEPPVDVRVTAFRIAQEALANVRKHSRATTCRVTVRRDQRGIVVEVQDDGVGFDPGSEVRSPEGHMGLSAMRERAEGAGGGSACCRPMPAPRSSSWFLCLGWAPHLTMRSRTMLHEPAAEQTGVLIVCEDVVEIAHLARHLGDHGVGPVTVCSDGLEAVEYLYRTGRYTGRRGADPALIILASDAKIVDGSSVADRMRSSRVGADVPIFLCGATSARANGKYGWLDLPATPEGVAGMLAEAGLLEGREKAG